MIPIPPNSKGFTIRKRLFRPCALSLLFWLSVGILSFSVQVLRHKALPRAQAIEPQIIFYVESPSQNMETLFTKKLIAQLAQKGRELCIALKELDDPTANVIARLNQANLRLWAWITLPYEKGYWLSTDSADLVPDLYDRFHAWSGSHGLKFDGIELDMEPMIQATVKIQASMKQGPCKLFKLLLSRNNYGAHAKGVKTYEGLVRRMQGDGYRVCVINYPLLLDDEKDMDATLQRIFHVASPRADEHTYMLYRSEYMKEHFPGAGPELIVSYGHDLKGRGIALGVVQAGSYDVECLTDDLLVASRFTQRIHIYNLELSVLADVIAAIDALDWRRTPELSLKNTVTCLAMRDLFILLPF